MSNETMTDAMILDRIEAYMPMGKDSPTYKAVAARLRGEAAPGGQAVDVVCPGWLAALSDAFHALKGGPKDFQAKKLNEMHTFLASTPLYTCPQPAAPAPVAGDAVARAREILAAEYDRAGYANSAQRIREKAILTEDDDTVIRAIVAALAQDRASQAGAQPPAVGVDVSDEMVERAFNAWCDVAVVDDYWVRNSREAIHAALHAALRTGGGA